MKKILALLLIIFGLWYFYNLGQKQEAIKNAKKDLLENKIDQDFQEKKQEQKTENQENNQGKNKPSYKIEKLDQNDFISIDNLDKKVENLVDKIKIT